MIQETWDSFMEWWPYSERMLFVCGTWFILELVYWGLTGFYFACHHFGWFKRYKILGGKEKEKCFNFFQTIKKKDQFPSWDLVKSSLIDLFIGHFILRGPFLYYLLYPSFHRWGK